MRKIWSSAKVARSVALSLRAPARSRPNGFSTMTLAPSAQPDSPSSPMTEPNSAGGMAR